MACGGGHVCKLSNFVCTTYICIGYATDCSHKYINMQYYLCTVVYIVHALCSVSIYLS